MRPLRSAIKAYLLDLKLNFHILVFFGYVKPLAYLCKYLWWAIKLWSKGAGFCLDIYTLSLSPSEVLNRELKIRFYWYWTQASPTTQPRLLKYSLVYCTTHHWLSHKRFVPSSRPSAHEAIFLLYDDLKSCEWCWRKMLLVQKQTWLT